MKYFIIIQKNSLKMITANIHLGKNITIDKSSSINNVKIGSNTKIAANVNIFGSEINLLEIGDGCYIGPNCIIEGFISKVTIGSNVSFAQNIKLMSGSGPNASPKLQKIFPIIKGEVRIGDHSWIGASVIIMPKVVIGRFCIIAANSFVNQSFDDYSIIGGTPAKLIRKLNQEEIKVLESND